MAPTRGGAVVTPSCALPGRHAGCNHNAKLPKPSMSIIELSIIFSRCPDLIEAVLGAAALAVKDGAELLKVNRKCGALLVVETQTSSLLPFGGCRYRSMQPQVMSRVS